MPLGADYPVTVKSPFPGLDPYLQRHWRGVHSAMIPYARDALTDLLPIDLHLLIEERVVFESDAPEGFPPIRGYLPDIGVVEYPPVAAGGSSGSVELREEAGP